MTSQQGKIRFLQKQLVKTFNVKNHLDLHIHISYVKALSHGAIFFCNLQRNSTFGRCKIGKYMFSSQFAKVFLTYQTFVTNLHLLRVELRCKLQEKLHCVTGS